MKQLDYIRGFCEAEFPGSISAIESGEVNGAVPKDVADHMRRTGLPGALVPASSGGRGLSAVQALRIAVGLGSASASVAVAFAMHGFSVATVASLEEDESRGTLKRVATENLLMCSAFSEGRHGQSLRQPSVAAVRSKDGYWLLNGSKKQTRYTLERTLTRHRQELERLAGGSEFIRPSTLTTRTRSTQALQFHPPFWRDQFSEINRFREEGKTFGFL